MKSLYLYPSFLIMLFVLPALAEESGTQLETVTITAAPESSESSPLDFLAKDNASGVLGNKKVLDTPFSMTVVDNKEITERGAKSIGQIFVNDASIYTPTSSITTDWWGTQIRGLPVRNYYVDDIPLLLYWGGDFPTEAVESVTALKGLTGFMYGFGEPGGAISYVLKRPTETPETSLNLGYRNPSLLSAHIDTSQNVGDDLAIRVNVATENGTAYNESEIDRSLISLAIDKGFGESVNWFTNLIYEENSIDGEPLQFYFSGYDVAGSKGKLPKVTYDYDDINIDNSYYDTETFIASTGVQWQLNEQWDLKYQTGFSRKEHRSNKAFAYLLNKEGDYNGYMYNFAGVLDNLFNQVMLHGNVSTGNIEHEIVGGIGQSRNKDRWVNNDNWYWSNDFNGNIHEEQTFRVTRNPDFSLTRVDWDVGQLNAFASDTIHFDEHWQTIIGLRFNSYDAEGDDGYQAKEITPTLALIYKPDESTSFYGSYVEALEPGTRVGATYANAGDVLDATVSNQYELGVKHESGNIDYTAALFRIERASQRVEEGGVFDYYKQDGLAIYDGVEFSGAYQFTNNLNIGLGVIYLDASIEQVSTASAAIEGNDPGYASDWQVVTNAEYNNLAGIQSLKLHGNVRYYGESYTDDSNTLKVPDYIVANAGLSYDLKIRDREWALYANVYNLFNEKYWAGGGWSSGNVGEARNLSLGLKTTF